MDKVRHICLSDINLTDLECQIFTFSGQPVLSEDWQKVSNRQSSVILPLKVQLAKLEKPHAPLLALEYDSEGEPENRTDEDDPKNFASGERRMALVKRVPTWAKEKEGVNLSPEVRSKMPGGSNFANRPYKRLLPPSSGIIQNVQVDPQPKQDAQDIYFQPPTMASQDDDEGTATFDSRHNTPLGSGPSGKEQLQSSNTPPRTPAISPNVPPVFTWAIGAREKPHENQAGRPLDKSIWNSSRTDIVRSEEESLNYVCSHMHKQLTGSSSLYTGISSRSLMDVELLMKKTFSPSIADLSEQNLKHSPEAQILSPWKKELANISNTLVRLMEFFMPTAYQCDVGAKYLGGVSELLMVYYRLQSFAYFLI
jgi:hypothetical protein